MNIVLVEDVVDLREEVAHWLRRRGHEVFPVSNGIELDRLLFSRKPQLILLDIGLPGDDGITICRRLQRVPDLHIAMLTARSGLDDRRLGVLSGADSYLVKPVDYEELDALIQRVSIRRLPGSDPASLWTLRAGKRKLVAPDGSEVPLTSLEFRLLLALVQRPDKTATRAELLANLGLPSAYEDRRIDVNLSRLRSKVRTCCGRELPVKANRAIGYGFLEDCKLID